MSAVVNSLLGSRPVSPAPPNPNSLSDSTATNSGVLNSIGNAIGSVASGAASTAASAVTSNLFSSRVIAVVLGLICIAGAILLYLGEDIAGAIGVGKNAVSKVAEVAA